MSTSLSCLHYWRINLIAAFSYGTPDMLLIRNYWRGDSIKIRVNRDGIITIGNIIGLPKLGYRQNQAELYEKNYKRKTIIYFIGTLLFQSKASTPRGESQESNPPSVFYHPVHG